MVFLFLLAFLRHNSLQACQLESVDSQSNQVFDQPNFDEANMQNFESCGGGGGGTPYTGQSLDNDNAIFSQEAELISTIELPDAEASLNLFEYSAESEFLDILIFPQLKIESLADAILYFDESYSLLDESLNQGMLTTTEGRFRAEVMIPEVFESRVSSNKSTILFIHATLSTELTNLVHNRNSGVSDTPDKTESGGSGSLSNELPDDESRSVLSSSIDSTFYQNSLGVIIGNSIASSEEAIGAHGLDDWIEKSSENLTSSGAGQSMGSGTSASCRVSAQAQSSSISFMAIAFLLAFLALTRRLLLTVLNARESRSAGKRSFHCDD